MLYPAELRGLFGALHCCKAPAAKPLARLGRQLSFAYLGKCDDAATLDGQYPPDRA